MANVALIAIGIMLLVGSYFMYQYLIGNAQSLSKNTYLKTSAAPIPLTNFTSPTGTRCAYSMWLFVNSLSATKAEPMHVFWVGTPDASPLSATTNPPAFKMCITSESHLQVFVKNKMYMITDNFPLQKWERIDISFDNKTMDVYLDGKLLRSFQMDESVVTTTTSVVAFGAIDAYVSGFNRTATPMDPTTSWNQYMSGNKPFMSSWMPQYGMSVELTKDSVAQKKLTLF